MLGRVRSILVRFLHLHDEDASGADPVWVDASWMPADHSCESDGWCEVVHPVTPITHTCEWDEDVARFISTDGWFLCADHARPLLDQPIRLLEDVEYNPFLDDDLPASGEIDLAELLAEPEYGTQTYWDTPNEDDPGVTTCTGCGAYRGVNEYGTEHVASGEVHGQFL